MTAWSTRQLSEVAKTIDYGFTATATTQPVGPKFLRITDIQNGTVNWETVPWCRANERSLSSFRLRPGDIVFARTGATTGKSFLIHECPEEAVFASYLIRVRLNDDVEPRFVSYFFDTPDYWRQIAQNARGAAQPGVNATKLKGLIIPLPPLAEQRRIAEILDRADALRIKRYQAMTQLDGLIESIFLDMFGDPALNPRQWPMVKLGDLASHFSDGPFGSNLKTSHYQDTGVRVIRLQNIGVGRFLDDNKVYISDSHFNTIKKYACYPGDVLIGTMGDPNLRACIQPPSLPVAVHKADCVLFRPNEAVSTAQYICTLLNQPATLKLATDLVHGQTRLRVSMGQLRQLYVPAPSVELQCTFGERIHLVEKTRSLFAQALREAEWLFASLQNRAFRGEL